MRRHVIWAIYIPAASFLVALFGNWAVDMLGSTEEGLIAGVTLAFLVIMLALVARRLP